MVNTAADLSRGRLPNRGEMSTSLRRHAVGALLAALPIAPASAQVEVSEIPPIAQGWTCSAHAINEPGDVLMNCTQSAGVPITFFREQASVWSTRDRTHMLVTPVAGNPRTFAAGLTFSCLLAALA